MAPLSSSEHEHKFPDSIAPGETVRGIVVAARRTRKARGENRVIDVQLEGGEVRSVFAGHGTLGLFDHVRLGDFAEVECIGDPFEEPATQRDDSPFGADRREERDAGGRRGPREFRWDLWPAKDQERPTWTTPELETLSSTTRGVKSTAAPAAGGSVRKGRAK